MAGGGRGNRLPKAKPASLPNYESTQFALPAISDVDVDDVGDDEDDDDDGALLL